jgi:hypothetical protein
VETFVHRKREKEKRRKKRKKKKKSLFVLESVKLF